MMNQQSNEDHNALKAELAALATKVHELESQQDDFKLATHSAHRRGFSRGLVFGLLPLVVGILLFATVLYGEGSGSLALFINPDGNVGIGTDHPAAPLHVEGNAVFSKRVGIGTLAPKKALDVHGPAEFRGSVGIDKSVVVRGDVIFMKRWRVDGQANFNGKAEFKEAPHLKGGATVRGQLLIFPIGSKPAELKIGSTAIREQQLKKILRLVN